MSAPEAGKNPNARKPPTFTKPKPRQGSGSNGSNGSPPARRPAETARSVPMERPQVEIPKHETSNRTGQLNFRVTPEFRDWFGRQLKFITAESGLKDNQVSALAVQVIGDSVDEIRYRALLMAGVIEPEEAADTPVDLADDNTNGNGS